MMQLFAVAGVALSMLAPVSASGSTAVPSDRVTLDVVTVNGSGCPAGTAAVAVAPDNSAFTVTYSDYTALTGSGVNAVERRKNCQLVVDVKFPQGFTFAVAKADYRGYASLAPGAKAVQKASYYFQGDSAVQAVTHNINAPLDDNWQVTDAADVASLVYSSCTAERYLNINTELRVSPGASGGAASFISMDSLDGSVSTQYHLAWKKC